MAQTNTGLDPWLGFSGTNYVHELTRQALRIAEEMTEEAVTAPNVPRVVAVLRRSLQVAADTASGIAATWQAVAGLGALQSLVFYPRQWEDFQPSEAKLLEGERIIVIADVPAAGGIPSDLIMTTDKIQYDDPTYGNVAFDVLDVTPISGPGLVRVKVRYGREGTA